MNNKMLERLYLVYPFSNKQINRDYYRNVRVRQLAQFLHRKSFDDNVGDMVSMVKIVEEIGTSKFSYLCDLHKTGELNEFIKFIDNVTKEKIV